MAGSRAHRQGALWNRALLLKRSVRLGVDPARIDLLGPAEHYEFLKYYDRIDIALDGLSSFMLRNPWQYGHE
jgi:methenyltetrahydromethanopterin cyclohydrolase